MTNPDYTAIAVVVDRSGSMGMIKNDAEGGLRTFVEEQRKVEGKCTLRLEEFDTVHDTVYKSTNIQDVPDYILRPRGGTALLDAMGRTITSFGEELEALDEDARPANVLVVVITDGGENSSREWTRDSVFKLIKEQEEKYNWKFVFLAANQDAVAVGRMYGFAADNSLTYDANSDGTRAVFASVSQYATTTRSGGQAAFSEEDRKAASKS